MRRDGRKPLPSQRVGGMNHFPGVQAEPTAELRSFVPIDMMTGQVEQPSDWPTPDSDRTGIHLTAKVLVAAALATSMLGLGVGAPRIGESAVVQAIPGERPRHQ
jgi:hypothetical protein